MKSIIVPAQITTVEDRIAGNLSFTQMALLIAPAICTGLLFVILPPFVSVTDPKLAMGVVLFVLSGTLAIRLRGELLLNHLVTRVSYNLRPKYYTYDKNDSYLRYEALLVAEETPSATLIPEAVESFVASLIDMPIRARLEQAINDPRANFQFDVKKGGLHVRIHEIKEKSI